MLVKIIGEQLVSVDAEDHNREIRLPFQSFAGLVDKPRGPNFGVIRDPRPRTLPTESAKEVVAVGAV